jgi:hypothetical protein
MVDKNGKAMMFYFLFCKAKIGWDLDCCWRFTKCWFIQNYIAFTTILKVLKSAQLSCLNFLGRSWSSHNFQYGGTLYYVGTPTYSGTEIYLVFSVQSHPWGFSKFNPISAKSSNLTSPTMWLVVYNKKLQMIILIAPNYIGRDNTPVTIPRLAVG